MPTIEDILRDLTRFESVTPADMACQEYMIAFLENLGFECQRYDNPPVSNFFARFGSQSPLLVFAGHTDVVPVGDITRWHANPFELTARDGLWYGRGVADMKGSLSAMLHMALRLVTEKPALVGSIGFLITSGEEGDYYDKGTPYVMSQLYEAGTKIDYCVVGEPSSTTTVGDIVKVGRRGSLTAKITVTGKQGHVAYPHLAKNPIHLVAPVLQELTNKTWDYGNEFFPPTSFQITPIHSDGGAGNVIPGELRLQCNFRYSTMVSSDELQQQVAECFTRHQIVSNIEWRLSGEPFLTTQGALIKSTVATIENLTGRTPELSTTGGTSDGRFIAPYGVEVVELGPVNASIHQINEWINPEDLQTLSDMYYMLSLDLLTG